MRVSAYMVKIAHFTLCIQEISQMYHNKSLRSRRPEFQILRVVNRIYNRNSQLFAIRSVMLYYLFAQIYI